jgi:hypothetical protein
VKDPAGVPGVQAFGLSCGIDGVLGMNDPGGEDVSCFHSARGLLIESGLESYARAE